MSFWQDRQIRRYCYFLTGLSLLLFSFGAWFVTVQTETVQAAFFAHENEIATSLLQQSISERVIADALSHSGGSPEGGRLLRKLGRGDGALWTLFPALSSFRHTSAVGMLAAAVCFSAALCAGTCLFFSRRDGLYCRSTALLERYREGDYSARMPQDGQGSFYRLVCGIDRLATMLQSQSEAQRRAKEFLKSTVSDISHQLKTSGRFAHVSGDYRR